MKSYSAVKIMTQAMLLISTFVSELILILILLLVLYGMVWYDKVLLSSEDHDTSRVEAEEGNFVLIPTSQHLQMFDLDI